MRTFNRRTLIRHVATLIFYGGVAVFITWPLITRMSTHLYGDFLTDATQSARHIWWIQYALKTGQSPFDQPMLGYPDGLQGAWLWANPFEYFPGWLFAFFMPLNAATNLQLLVHLTLDGWAMYVLVYHLTQRKQQPAIVAGLVFMVYPALQSRIYGGHGGVLALWPLPLYLYMLFRLRDSYLTAKTQRTPRKPLSIHPRRLLPLSILERGLGGEVLAALFFALSIAGNSTLLVYYTLPTAGIFLLALAWEHNWRWLRRVLLATLLGGILSLVFLLPLAIETANAPQYNPDIGGSVTYSADLLAIVSPSFLHPLYKHLDYPGHVLGTNLLEGTGYIGLVVLPLIGLAVWRQKSARWWLLLALVAWIFSLGPLLKIQDRPVSVTIDGYASYVPLPWGGLQHLPILNISRTPGRFNLTVGLAVAVLAGYGAAYLGEKDENRTAKSPSRQDKEEKKDDFEPPRYGVPCQAIIGCDWGTER